MPGKKENNKTLTKCQRQPKKIILQRTMNNNSINPSSKTKLTNSDAVHAGHFTKWWTSFFLLLISPAAWSGAVCQGYLHPKQPNGKIVVLPTNLGDATASIASINVNNSMPNGSILKSAILNGATIQSVYCFWPTISESLGIYDTLSPYGDDVYDTNVAGIGIRITSRQDDGYGYRYPSIRPLGSLYIFETATPDSGWARSYGVTIEIIKTGNVVSGTVGGGHIGSLAYIDQDGGTSTRRWFLNPVQITAPTPTCDIRAGDANRTITLDRVMANELSAGNYFKAQDFNIGVTNCANASQATFTFDGATAPSHLGGNYHWANLANSASNVVISLERTNGTTRHICNATDTGCDRTVSVPVASGQATLPLRASYFYGPTDGSPPVAGAVRTNITVTMSYL